MSEVEMVRYGLLIAFTRNLGDDIQSLAAKQFLPRIDLIIDRDSPNKVRCTDKVKVIFNGWFTYKPQNFPPAPCIIPLFVSFHIHPKVADKFLREKMVKYLKMHEPIGCRDLYTMRLLNEKGIDAYFSGDLCFTLDRRFRLGCKKEDKILIVDLDEEALKVLPDKVLQQAVFLTHKHFEYASDKLFYLLRVVRGKRIFKALKFMQRPFITTVKFMRDFELKMRSKNVGANDKLKRAEQAIKQYASAKLVITSRLHAALVAVAFEVPAFFVHRDPEEPRFQGLLNFMHYYSVDVFKKKVKDMDFESPPRNPNILLLKKLKRKLLQTCENFIRYS